MWRIRLDSQGQRLALEVRDADLLLTRFYSFSTATRSLLQLPLPEGQAWWQGLEDAHENHIYLHGYGDRKLGQHKGIKAMAAATGSVAWQATELAFYGIAAEGLLAYPAAAPESAFLLLHPKTGQQLQAGIPQRQAAAEVAQYQGQRDRQVIYPMRYLEGEGYFREVQQFLEAQHLIGATQAVEYAETEGAIVVSYYVRSAGGELQNWLAVYDTAGTLRLKELLADGLSGIGSDTFFIFMDDLYFVKDKAILEVYRLLAQ